MVWLVKGLLEQPCEDTEDFAFWCLKVTLPPRPHHNSEKNSKKSPQPRSLYTTTTNCLRNTAAISSTKMGKSKLVCSPFPPFSDGNCTTDS